MLWTTQRRSTPCIHWEGKGRGNKPPQRYRRKTPDSSGLCKRTTSWSWTCVKMFYCLASRQISIKKGNADWRTKISALNNRYFHSLEQIIHMTCSLGGHRSESNHSGLPYISQQKSNSEDVHPFILEKHKLCLCPPQIHRDWGKKQLEMDDIPMFIHFNPPLGLSSLLRWP